MTVLDQKVTPPGTARTDWLIAAELAQRLGGDFGVHGSDSELWAELVANSPGPRRRDHRGAAAPDARRRDRPARRRRCPVRRRREPIVPPAQNAYSLRLVLSRPLYDGGTLLAAVAVVRRARPTPSARLSPADAAPLGVGRRPGRQASLGQRIARSSSAVVDNGVPAGLGRAGAQRHGRRRHHAHRRRPTRSATSGWR